MPGMSVYHGWCLTFVCFISFSASEATSCTPETKAVRWEIFKELKLTWNEASHFCHDRGGNLPTLNTRMAIHAIGQQATTWFGVWDRFQDFWMGLHSATPDAYPNLWERDCSLQEKGFEPWDSYGNEPNSLGVSLCNRVTKGAMVGQTLWRTMDCDRDYTVVCEYSQGNCTYNAFYNRTMTLAEVDAWAGDVSDVGRCWELCVSLVEGAQECVAAYFDGLSGQCIIHLGLQLLQDLSDLNTTPAATASQVFQRVLMLRRCFNSTINTTVTRYTSYSNNDNRPRPAGQTCSSSYQEVNYQDCTPPDIRNSSSLPLSTSTPLPSSSSTPSFEVTSSPTVTSSSSSPMIPSSSAVTSTSTTSESSTIRSPSSSQREETTSLSSGVSTILESTSPSISPTNEISQDVSKSTQGFSSAAFETTQKHVTTAVDDETTQTEVATDSITNAVQPITSAAVPRTNTNTEDMTKDFAPMYSPSPRTTNPRLCPCLCRLSSSTQDPTENKSSSNEDLIPVQQLSKYRRSKESVYIDKPVDKGISVVFIAITLTIVLPVFLCDIKHLNLKKCGRCRRKELTSHETNITGIAIKK